MLSIYVVIIVFLLCLAVVDLFVGVSNDAVNFLTSAVGAKSARWRTILIIASVGILCGALLSSGMMDVARHGVLHPEHFALHEVLTIFLAVMVSDVLILDIFNTLGLPTSTTVSLVFELLGATFLLSLVKVSGDGTLSMAMLINSDKALQMIVAIFVSVGIAFVCGAFVQYVSRLLFTFHSSSRRWYTVSLFGGVAFSLLAYFMFVKGLASSPLLPSSVRAVVSGSGIGLLLFVGGSVLSLVLHLCRVDVFRVIILVGTFALAMAFASNDLVNFIGVPLAGLSAWQDFAANGAGASATTYMMSTLCSSARSPFLYLFLAGVVMIVAMCTSKKAQRVVRTSVDLSRQDEGDEMFGSSRMARNLVRLADGGAALYRRYTPSFVRRWIEGRFSQSEDVVEGAAFDSVRAAVTLVLSAALILVGTLYKLPLSTTYVTFMVAMGSSLADKAWRRDSAVYRVTGVLSVIGGWFITAGAAFLVAGTVCLLLHVGGVVAMVVALFLVVVLLVRSQRRYARRQQQEQSDALGTVMLRCKEPVLVLDMLRTHVARGQRDLLLFLHDEYGNIFSGLVDDDVRLLRHSLRALTDQRTALKKGRRREYLALKHVPRAVALERNTWFHLLSNCDAQAVYCLRRMAEPIEEHVANRFLPLPAEYAAQYRRTLLAVQAFLADAAGLNFFLANDDIPSPSLPHSEETVAALRLRAKDLKKMLAQQRDALLDSMQDSTNEAYNISAVYLNILQETQELLATVRHLLRAAEKFLSPTAA